MQMRSQWALFRIAALPLWKLKGKFNFFLPPLKEMWFRTGFITSHLFSLCVFPSTVISCSYKPAFVLQNFLCLDVAFSESFPPLNSYCKVLVHLQITRLQFLSPEKEEVQVLNLQPLSLVLFPRHFLFTIVNLIFWQSNEKVIHFSSAELLIKNVDDLSLGDGFSPLWILVNHIFDKSQNFCKIKHKNLLSDPGGSSVVDLFWGMHVQDCLCLSSVLNCRNTSLSSKVFFLFSRIWLMKGNLSKKYWST